MGAPNDPIKREIWINRLSESHIGIKTWNKGKTKNSNNTLLLMSIATKGKKRNKEFSRYVSIAQTKRYKRVFQTIIKNNIPLMKKLINDPIINGLLLSDGYISKPPGNGNSRLILEQSDLHLDFIKKIESCLANYNFRTKIKHNQRYDKRTGKTYKSFCLSTNLHPLITLLRNIWYPKGKKIVPKIIKISPELLCSWFEGDGSSRILQNRRHAKQVCVQLSTEGFDTDSISFLNKSMKELGIMNSINKENRILIFQNESVVKFMDMIKPLIVKSFNYKIKYPTYKTSYEFRSDPNYKKRLSINKSKKKNELIYQIG